MFARILIANRGEIARRVIRTCKRLGIRSVAVYSDADAEALHVVEADDGVPIGGAAARDSYLSIDSIIAAARVSGVEAIHPGYGFLSENAAFAQACADAGFVFIGPPPDAIRAMGEKDRAKEIMAAAGVPVLPGCAAPGERKGGFAAAAKACGFPLLVKPIAGGGGRGLRRVHTADELETALDASRREAMAAFGDDRLMVEHYLERPRHVEVQVFVDAEGRAVHLFERDCSVQRRHQKVIEEAPAPALDQTVRDGLYAAALRAVSAIDYRGAGTVEFLVDGSGGYFFAEMNTRLQVEHPVTEMVTGLDLVEWQIRIAAGEVMPRAQDEIALRGHAIEARLYAEDPDRDYLPAVGRVERLRLPAPGGPLRIECGLRTGDAVTPYYDPMIAKLIAHGRDRAEAQQRLLAALGETLVAGVATNLGLLETVLGSGAFAGARFDTALLERHQGDFITPQEAADDRTLALAALALLHERRAASDGLSPWSDRSGWHLNQEPEQDVWLRAGERVLQIGARGVWPNFTLRLPGGEIAASFSGWHDDRLQARLDGQPAKALVIAAADAVFVIADGRRHRFERHDPLAARPLASALSGSLSSTIPGIVKAVLVAPGAAVRRGATLLVVEAMKLEVPIAAPEDGIVDKVLVSAGDQVSEGEPVIVLRPEKESRA